MSASAEYDFAGHDERVRQHYDHAREKHPYFCDVVLPHLPQFCPKDYFASRLDRVRRTLARRTKHGSVYPELLLDCEIAELLEALEMCNHKGAVEECYDIAAVALRIVDVLEGRQKLGRPQTISGNSAGSKKENKQ